MEGGPLLNPACKAIHQTREIDGSWGPLGYWVCPLPKVTHPVSIPHWGLSLLLRFHLFPAVLDCGLRQDTVSQCGDTQRGYQTIVIFHTSTNLTESHRQEVSTSSLAPRRHRWLPQTEDWGAFLVATTGIRVYLSVLHLASFFAPFSITCINCV